MPIFDIMFFMALGSRFGIMLSLLSNATNTFYTVLL